MKISTDVYIYVQSVKNFMSTHQEAKEYFIGNGDELKFYGYLEQIAQMNLDKKGDVMLTKEQFEQLREMMLDDETDDIEVSIDETEFFNNKSTSISMEIPGYGKIFLN